MIWTREAVGLKGYHVEPRAGNNDVDPSSFKNDPDQSLLSYILNRKTSSCKQIPSQKPTKTSIHPLGPHMYLNRKCGGGH